MPQAIIPDSQSRKAINEAVQAQINLCYTCGSCINECPVNVATGRLRPRNLVWMANLGMMDELLQTPEIWYCIQCGRCEKVCPMTVNPAALIRYLRWEAVNRGVRPAAAAAELQELIQSFQRVRYHMAAECLNGADRLDLAGKWDELADKEVAPLAQSAQSVRLDRATRTFRSKCLDYLDFPINTTECFTCGECSNACPVAFERQVFDPQALIRLANLGLKDLGLSSPSLWLCVQCQSCTGVCSQVVKGHLVLRRLRELAVNEGYVPIDFATKWKNLEDQLYPLLLERIDRMLGETG